RKLEGFDASGVMVKTRVKNWTITKKPTTKTRIEKEYEVFKPTENPNTWKISRKRLKPNETTQAEAGALALSGGSAASRSSVNNCTRPQSEQVN
ncbi:replication endonuclease, partial [Vibrio anguillarum]|nr:replication endonuclease [Vibrio anguillarum]